MEQPLAAAESERGHGGSIIARPVDDDSVGEELFKRGETGRKDFQINRLEKGVPTMTRDYSIMVENVAESDAALVTVSQVGEDEVEDFKPTELPVGGSNVFDDLRLVHTVMDKLEIRFWA